MEEKIVAALSYAILVSGLLLRKNRRIHPILMSLGISLDLVLVVTLQIQRQVIQDTMTETYTAFQWGHIIASIVAVVLYIPVLILGVRQVLQRGGPAGRRWHIRVALSAFAFRSTGFVLMFSM